MHLQLEGHLLSVHQESTVEPLFKDTFLKRTLHHYGAFTSLFGFSVS